MPHTTTTTTRQKKKQRSKQKHQIKEKENKKRKKERTLLYVELKKFNHGRSLLRRRRRRSVKGIPALVLGQLLKTFEDDLRVLLKKDVVLLNRVLLETCEEKPPNLRQSYYLITSFSPKTLGNPVISGHPHSARLSIPLNTKRRNIKPKGEKKHHSIPLRVSFYPEITN